MLDQLLAGAVAEQDLRHLGQTVGRQPGGGVVRLGIVAADAAGGAAWGPGLAGSGGWSAPRPNVALKNRELPPVQLFDLDNDPHELSNLAIGETAHPEIDSLRELCENQWNIPALTEQITSSQRRRLFLREVLKSGTPVNWDYVPSDQAEAHCLRDNQTYNEWAYQILK